MSWLTNGPHIISGLMVLRNTENDWRPAHPVFSSSGSMG